MKKTEYINVRIDEETKKRAEKVLDELNLRISDAINIFLRQSVRENAIPFNISREVPNSDTIAAINEFEEFKKKSRTSFPIP